MIKSILCRKKVDIKFLLSALRYPYVIFSNLITYFFSNTMMLIMYVKKITLNPFKTRLFPDKFSSTNSFGSGNRYTINIF